MRAASSRADFNGDNAARSRSAAGTLRRDLRVQAQQRAPASRPEGRSRTRATGHRTDLARRRLQRRRPPRHRHRERQAGTVVDPAPQRGQHRLHASRPDMAIGDRAAQLAPRDFNGDGRARPRRDQLICDDLSPCCSARATGRSRPRRNVPVERTGRSASPRQTSTATARRSRRGEPEQPLGHRAPALGSGFVADAGSPLPTGQDGANGLAAADFNGDGRTDIAVSNQSSTRSPSCSTPRPSPPRRRRPTSTATATASRRPPTATTQPGDQARCGRRARRRDRPGLQRPRRRLPVIARTIAGFWATFAGPYTKFTALTVKPARKGDRVKLTCKGPGCRAKGKTVRVKKNKRSISMLKHLKGSRLRKGAVVRLRVTRAGHDRARQHVDDPCPEGAQARAALRACRARRSRSAARNGHARHAARPSPRARLPVSPVQLPDPLRARSSPRVPLAHHPRRSPCEVDRPRRLRARAVRGRPARTCPASTATRRTTSRPASCRAMPSRRRSSTISDELQGGEQAPIVIVYRREGGLDAGGQGEDRR